MLQEKIKEIEKEMNDYFILLQESETPKEQIRYRGILQGLEMALLILKESRENSIGTNVCPVCKEKIVLCSPIVQDGEVTYHSDCYFKVK